MEKGRTERDGHKLATPYHLGGGRALVVVSRRIWAQPTHEACAYLARRDDGRARWIFDQGARRDLFRERAPWQDPDRRHVRGFHWGIVDGFDRALLVPDYGEQPFADVVAWCLTFAQG